MQACALHLFHAVFPRVFVCRDDGLHFLRRDGEVAARGPDAVAFAVENGGFVDIAGADEAGVEEGRISLCMEWAGRRASVEWKDCTLCRRRLDGFC